MGQISKTVKSDFKDLFKQIDDITSEKKKKFILDPDPVKKKERITRCIYDPQFFFTTYLSHYFEDSPAPYHSQLPKLFEYKQRPLVILAPRGGAKSTFIFGETLRLLVTGQQKFLIRVEKNEDIAKKELLKIKNEIEGNIKLREDFGNLVGHPWGAKDLYLSNNCMVWGRGCEQPIRGTTFYNWRPTGIIYNDVEDLDQVRNPKLVDKIYEAIFADAVPALNPRSSGGGFLAIVGTLLGKDSMLAKLRKHPRVKEVYYEALEGDPQVIEMLLTKVSRDVAKFADYSNSITGKEIGDDERLRDFFRNDPEYKELIDQVNSYWSSRYCVEDLLMIAIDIGTVLFKQEYLHITPDSTSMGFFSDEWFERSQNNYFLEEIPHRNLARCIFLDPSYKSKDNSDHKAFVTGIYDISTQTGFIIDVTASVMTYDDMVATSFRLARKYLLGDMILGNKTIPANAFIDTVFAYENNGAQEWLDNIFRDKSKEYEFQLPKLTGVPHVGNKEARISRLSLYFERAKIKLDLGKKWADILKIQLCGLANNKIKDDCADALEGWWSIVEKIKSNIIFGKIDQSFHIPKKDTQKIDFREPLYDKKQTGRLFNSYTKRERTF